LRPVAKYELLIDGRGRWRAKSDGEVRDWLRDYAEEHAQDDPEATHVQIRRLSPFSWLTGGSLVARAHFVDS
jgi:hypothetical protein